MGYEINVSKRINRLGEDRYEHYFATAERSIGYCKVTLKELVEKFKVAFPEPDFKVDVWNIEKTGAPVDVNKL
ncbi:MAG TPA: hypothetical protein VK172_10275 [Lentimicrobium sp.]|nr:hypothetical protein [Lentimicrobium sp.]